MAASGALGDGIHHAGLGQHVHFSHVLRQPPGLEIRGTHGRRLAGLVNDGGLHQDVAEQIARNPPHGRLVQIALQQKTVCGRDHVVVLKPPIVGP